MKIITLQDVINRDDNAGCLKVSNLPTLDYIECKIDRYAEDPLDLGLWFEAVFRKNQDDEAPVFVGLGSISIKDFPKWRIEPAARRKLRQDNFDDSDEWGREVVLILFNKFAKPKLFKDKFGDWILEFKFAKHILSAQVPDMFAPVE